MASRMLSFVPATVLLIWVGFYAVTAVILLSGGENLPWSLGQKAEQDISARVEFTVLNDARTHQEREVAAAGAPDVYLANPAPLEAIRGRLAELLKLAKSSAEDDAKLKAELATRKWVLDDEGIRVLRQMAADERSAAYDKLAGDLLTRLEHEYIVEVAKNPIRRTPPRTSMLRRGDERIELTTATLQYATNREHIEKRARQLADEVFPQPLRALAANIVIDELSPPAIAQPEQSPAEPVNKRALWAYSHEETRKELERAKALVKDVVVEYRAGATLVEAGTVLGNEEIALLKRENEVYRERQTRDPVLRKEQLLRQVGISGMVLIVTIGLVAYTLSYQDRVFRNSARALGVAALLATMILLARINERVQNPWDSPREFSVLLVVMTAILMAIAYNQRFAFGVTGVLAIFVTLASRGDFGLFLTLMAAMGVAVFALRDVRSRGKIIAVGAIAAGAAFMASVLTSLMDGQEARYVLPHGLAAASAALGAGFIVQGILHYFERLFGIATSLTLLEWCDAGQPLLRRLAQEAPGTYSHSLILSQMAEEASNAIGGNGLLARVGALYHDIGKTQKSPYFVENQEARMNRHDRLAPNMSLLIIVGHVKDGIELARAYGLPRVLHQFIAEHHGTTVVKYFHHKADEVAARNRARGWNDREVSENEFRYPGPKPRSKESAILMICDSCEGAVRALSEPTPGRIEALIHQVVMERLNDGQFDACDITMRELNQVEQSLVKSLCAIHHGRIKYPKAADRPRSVASSAWANGHSGAEPTNGGGASATPSAAGSPARAATTDSAIPAPALAAGPAPSAESS